MRVLGIARGYAVGAIFFSILATGLAFWGTESIRIHVERMNLAQASYEAHLRLATHSAQLFQAFSEAAVSGPNEGAEVRAALRAEIDKDFRTIRAIIASEIKLVGEEEIEELELLEELEETTERLIAKFDAVEGDPSQDKIMSWRQMMPDFSHEVNTNHAIFMKNALEEEQEEVAETKELLTADIRATRIAALMFLVISISFMLGLFRYHRQNVTTPLLALIKGAQAMESGNLKSEIPETGGHEVAQVTQTLNRMARRIRSRQAELESKNTTLEQLVAERTAELERLLDEARINAARRHQMLADVSHELRTPLTIITGETNITLRRKNVSSEEYREALRRAQESAQHTSAIVDDLLFISRQESGQLRLKLDSVNLVDVVSDAIALSSVPAHLEADRPEIMLRLDALRMRQAILALLHNTKVHGANETRVALKLSATTCEVVIKDNGPGMTDAEKASCFERFYRGTSPGRGQDQGYGLGLPVVKAIAIAHGADVRMEDTPGGGLTVVMSMPCMTQLKAVS